MAAVDCFHLLYREVAKSCHNHFEFLTVVGAIYTARKGFCILYKCYTAFRLHVTPYLLRRKNLVKEYGEWAVVTGATDRVGRAYAEELASRGMNIILICSDSEDLHNVSENIVGTYRVNTSIIHTDFSKGCEEYHAIKKLVKDLDVGILVNNARVFYEYPQRIMEIPEDMAWELINVNVTAAVMMTRIVIPGMVQRRRGGIVNVSPGTESHHRNSTHIAASKAYLDVFSRKLQCELRSSGIFVQLLTPLSVGKRHRPSSGIFNYLPDFVPSSTVYARHAVRTLGVSSKTTGYWAHSLQLLACQCIPGWLCASIGRVLQY